MTDIVREWIKDAEAFEFQKMYKLSKANNFEFIKRQGDFYITLLNRMYNILQETPNAQYETQKEELSDIAHALLVYSDKCTETNFSGVDKLSNQLYVATIYFLIGYEAIATILLKGIDLNAFGTSSAQITFYLVSGAAYRLKDVYDDSVKNALSEIRSFLLRGNDGLDKIISVVENKFDRFSFDNLDDFFDTAILVHTLRKFRNHNLRDTLYNNDPNTDWTDYIKFSKEQHILSFLPSQEDAILKGLLTYKKSFSLKMPTSAGKSYITELIIYQELKNNPEAKILYLAPLRSLSRELKERFVKVGHKLGFTTRAIYGGSIYTIDQSVLDNAQLLISTPEAFTSLEETLDEQLKRFSLVICDEGQLLDSMKRGINYELLLTRLKKIENVRYLFLSAIIPNIEDVNTWLGGDNDEVGDSKYRPCPIKFACLNNDFSLDIKDESYESTKYSIPEFLSDSEKIGVASTNRARSCAVALKSLEAGSVLLFTARKSGKMGCGKIGEDLLLLISKEHLPDPRLYSISCDELDSIADYVAFQFGKEHKLPCYISHGYAYHHGSLPQDIRELIEKAYSDKVLPLLICTTTLAEGVNLPVQTLVLYNLSRYNYQYQTTEVIDITDIKNIVGRTGRAGYQRFGVVIYGGDKSKLPYKNIVAALKNQGVHKIMGTLFDVTRVFYNLRDKVDDNSINKALEYYGMTSAIDTMITRSSGIDALEDIDIEEIVKESLAYHIGDENIREYLKRVFRIRYNILSKRLNQNNFKAFHFSGLSIEDLEVVEKIVNTEVLTNIDIEHPLSDSWTDFAINLVMSMPGFINVDIQTADDENPHKLNSHEIKDLMNNWINGAQYWELASAMKCDVDNAIELVMFLHNSFIIIMAAIVRYIQSLGVNTDYLRSWIDMVKYGVNNEQKLLLIKSGLTDRIAVNVLMETRIKDHLHYDNELILRASMKTIKDDLALEIEKADIPSLSKGHINVFLKSL